MSRRPELDGLADRTVFRITEAGRQALASFRRPRVQVGCLGLWIRKIPFYVKTFRAVRAGHLRVCARCPFCSRLATPQPRMVEASWMSTRWIRRVSFGSTWCQRWPCPDCRNPWWIATGRSRCRDTECAQHRVCTCDLPF